MSNPIGSPSSRGSFSRGRGSPLNLGSLLNPNTGSPVISESDSEIKRPPSSASKICGDPDWFDRWMAGLKVEYDDLLGLGTTFPEFDELLASFPTTLPPEDQPSNDVVSENPVFFDGLNFLYCDSGSVIEGFDFRKNWSILEHTYTEFNLHHENEQSLRQGPDSVIGRVFGLATSGTTRREVEFTLNIPRATSEAFVGKPPATCKADLAIILQVPLDNAVFEDLDGVQLYLDSFKLGCARSTAGRVVHLKNGIRLPLIFIEYKVDAVPVATNQAILDISVSAAFLRSLGVTGVHVWGVVISNDKFLLLSGFVGDTKTIIRTDARSRKLGDLKTPAGFTNFYILLHRLKKKITWDLREPLQKLTSTKIKAGVDNAKKYFSWHEPSDKPPPPPNSKCKGDPSPSHPGKRHKEETDAEEMWFDYSESFDDSIDELKTPNESFRSPSPQKPIAIGHLQEFAQTMDAAMV